MTRGQLTRRIHEISTSEPLVVFPPHYVVFDDCDFIIPPLPALVLLFPFAPDRSVPRVFVLAGGRWEKPARIRKKRGYQHELLPFPDGTRPRVAAHPPRSRNSRAGLER